MSAVRGVEWAAGLFEGEGCISIGRRGTGPFTTEVGRTTLVLSLCSTDKDVIDEFLRIIGRGYIGESHWYRAQGHKPQWRWQTKNMTEFETVLRVLLPWFGERRTARAHEALAVLEAKRERRRELGRIQLGGKRKTIVRDAAGRYA